MSAPIATLNVPALPLHEAGEYVAGAYIVLFLLILIYVSIMATRLNRIERELGELLELTESPTQTPTASGPDRTQPQSTSPDLDSNRSQSTAPDPDRPRRASTPA